VSSTRQDGRGIWVPPTAANGCEQSVYHPSKDKVGEVKDVLPPRDGKVSQLIIGVGGFLATLWARLTSPFRSMLQNTARAKDSARSQVRPQHHMVGACGKQLRRR
jgi:hypothetical protein